MERFVEHWARPRLATLLVALRAWQDEAFITARRAAIVERLLRGSVLPGPALAVIARCLVPRAGARWRGCFHA